MLEEAGYLEITKTFEGRKPRTWARPPAEGKAALAEEMAALRELVTRYEANGAAGRAGGGARPGDDP